MPISKINKGVSLNGVFPHLMKNRKDFLEKDDSSFLFSRGYLITKEDIKITSHFERTTIGNYNLFYHKKCLVDSSNKNDIQLTILGFAVFANKNYIDTNKRESEILLNIYTKSKKEFLDAIDCLCGRFVIIISDNNFLHIFGDACGMKPVYYSTTKNCFASHMELLNLVAKEDFSEIEKHIQKNNYVYNYAYPGNATLYKDIYCLSSDFELTIDSNGKCKTERFFPRKQIENYNNVLFAKNKLQECFETTLQEIKRKNRKILMSITAGKDTRVSFYLTKKYKDEIFYFTEDRDFDYEKTYELAKEYDLNWIGSDPKDIHYNDNIFKANFEEITKKNIFPSSSNYTLRTQFWNLNIFDIDDDYIHIHSNCSETARGRGSSTDVSGGFPYKKEEFSFEKYYQSYINSTVTYYDKKKKDSQLESLKKDKFMISFIYEYLKMLDLDKVIEYGYNPWDFLYDNQRCSQFIAQTHMTNDVIFESISLSNCRQSLKTMWLIPDEFITNAGLLYDSILNENDSLIRITSLGKNFKDNNTKEEKEKYYTEIYGGEIVNKVLNKTPNEKIDYAKKILKINSTIKWAYIEIVNQACIINDLETAKEYYLKMLDYDFDLASHWVGDYFTGKLFIKNQDDAKNIILDIYKKNNEIAWVNKQMSVIKQKESDYKGSLNYAKKAFELSPTNKWIAKNLLYSYNLLKDFQTIKGLLKNEMILFEDCEWWHYYSSIVFFEEKNIDFAFKEILKAEEINKNDYPIISLKKKIENIKNKEE